MNGDMTAARRCGDLYSDHKGRGCKLVLGHSGPCNSKWEIVRAKTPDLDDCLDDLSAENQARYEQLDEEQKTEEAL